MPLSWSVWGALIVEVKDGPIQALSSGLRTAGPSKPDAHKYQPPEIKALAEGQRRYAYSTTPPRLGTVSSSSYSCDLGDILRVLRYFCLPYVGSSPRRGKGSRKLGSEFKLAHVHASIRHSGRGAAITEPYIQKDLFPVLFAAINDRQSTCGACTPCKCS